MTRPALTGWNIDTELMADQIPTRFRSKERMISDCLLVGYQDFLECMAKINPNANPPDAQVCCVEANNSGLELRILLRSKWFSPYLGRQRLCSFWHDGIYHWNQLMDMVGRDASEREQPNIGFGWTIGYYPRQCPGGGELTWLLRQKWSIPGTGRILQCVRGDLHNILVEFER